MKQYSFWFVVGSQKLYGPEVLETVDARAKEMAEEMWQTMTKPYADKLLYGKGRIYKNASLEQVFTELNVIPDFSTDDCLCPILFLHRTLDDAEVYFVSNQSDSSVSFNASFRVKNMQPELWNPLDASVRNSPVHFQQFPYSSPFQPYSAYTSPSISTNSMLLSFHQRPTVFILLTSPFKIFILRYALRKLFPSRQ